MKTCFAPAERADDDVLAAEIEFVGNNPVVTGLLESVGGLLAVLDEHRQIVTLNDSLLKMLGIEKSEQVLGLRPGEALECIHAGEEPAGCGTTKYCSTCGAAIAIVSSLEQGRPHERICALSARRGGNAVEIALLVRSHPIAIDGKRFLMLFIQDITQQEQRAALERTFYHDVNNMLSMLVGASELLADENPSPQAGMIHQAALRLHREIAIQRCLSDSGACRYQPIRKRVGPDRILAEMKSFFCAHPAAARKEIAFRTDCPDVAVYTDISLLLRVLCNMVINALEATEESGVIRVWAEREETHLCFCVWNAQEIAPDIANRVFQRNFSTKNQAGRGIGTFSMKLFGEEILGGKVSFTTGPEDGTVFRFAHPQRTVFQNRQV